MKLYGSIASPYVARVVMYARLKGQDLELCDVPGGMRSDEFMAITPIGKIPALVTDEGATIPESEVICEYLEDVYPDPSGLPADPLGRATSRSISRIVDLYLAPASSNMARQINPETRDQAVVDDAKEKFAKAFSYMEHFMGPGPYACGDSLTLGDCSAAPYMMLMKKMVFEHFDDIPDPTVGEGRLATWWQAIEANEVSAGVIAEYGTAVEGFLKFLVKRVSG